MNGIIATATTNDISLYDAFRYCFWVVTAIVCICSALSALVTYCWTKFETTTTKKLISYTWHFALSLPVRAWNTCKEYKDGITTIIHNQPEPKQIDVK